MTLYELVTSAIILLVIAIVLSCLWHERNARISPTPILPWVRKKALDLALQYKTPEGLYKITDLGSGWGGLVSVLAKNYKASTITGYEISPLPRLLSQIRAMLSGRRFTIKKTNFFKEDLSHYDIVFCYLSPHHMKDLIPQFQTLKPGSIIVSCSFAIPGWEYKDRTTCKGIVNIPIYLYEV